MPKNFIVSLLNEQYLVVSLYRWILILFLQLVKFSIRFTIILLLVIVTLHVISFIDMHCQIKLEIVLTRFIFFFFVLCLDRMPQIFKPSAALQRLKSSRQRTIALLNQLETLIDLNEIRRTRYGEYFTRQDLSVHFPDVPDFRLQEFVDQVVRQRQDFLQRILNMNSDNEDSDEGIAC